MQKDALKKVAILGSGNLLFGDDALGIYTAKYLKENYHFEDAVEILEHGIIGLDLLDVFIEYELVIILLAQESSDADRVRFMTSEQFLADTEMKKTVSERLIEQRLETLFLSDGVAEVIFIGMGVKERQNMELGLTQSTQDSFEKYVYAILTKLESFMIYAKKKKAQRTLDEVMHCLAFERGEG